MCAQQNAIIGQYFRKRDVNLGQSKAKSYICSVIKLCELHNSSKAQHGSSKAHHIVAHKHTT